MRIFDLPPNSFWCGATIPAVVDVVDASPYSRGLVSYSRLSWSGGRCYAAGSTAHSAVGHFSI